MKKDVAYGPKSEFAEIQDCFRDKNLLKALGMANPMDYTIPPEFQADRDCFSGDAMEDKRPTIMGEVCAECNLKDDWTRMLKCDFCDLIWHQKCVTPPLIHVRAYFYWMCPRHPETVIDSVLIGDEISREDRRRLYDKYADVEPSYEIFEEFCIKTEQFRMKSEVFDSEEMYYDPEEASTSFMQTVIKPRQTSRKTTGRSASKKKSNGRFFASSWDFPGLSSRETSPSRKNSRKSPDSVATERKDRVLDKIDKKRSIKLTEEEIIMSIMPVEESSRAEYLTQKMLGTDIEQSTNFFNRHSAMIDRIRAFYGNLPEKELIKLMREDLDPVETIRGGGTQSIISQNEKPYRKKLKADVEVLIQHVGLGTDSTERHFNSIGTEAFYRRCAPPVTARNVLNQKTLREVVLNSQKEAHEGAGVYEYHAEPEQLENLVLLAYEPSFESPEDRDTYFVPSMTIWSKEPICALTRKWAASGASKQAPPSSSSSEAPSVEAEVKEEVVEEEDEENEARMRRESTATSSIVYNNDTGPLEFIEENMPPPAATITEKSDPFDFSSLEMPEIHEKAETVYEAEGYYGESDDLPLDLRRTKSESDLVDRIIWPLVRSALQNFIRREDCHQMHLEHNYSSLYQTHDSDEENQPVVEVEKLITYEEYQENLYSAEFASPQTPPPIPPPPAVYYDNFSDAPRKRGRPVGSRNRKEGDTTIPKQQRKRNPQPVGRGRGRGGGRPRGSRSSRGSMDDGGGSRRHSTASDANESAELLNQPVTKQLRDEIKEIKLKYTKMMMDRGFEQAKDEYFRNRDAALSKWTPEQWKEHNEQCVAARLSSLIPYDQRYFLPTQRVLARLDLEDGDLRLPAVHLPIAIQRCVTKLGTAHDCHVRCDKLTGDAWCSVLADYHCDIVRDYYSDNFYISTLGTEAVFVDGRAVRRPRLTPFEAAEKLRTRGSSTIIPPHIKCRCQKHSDLQISRQESTGELVRCGILKLEHGARIQIGCVAFIFSRI